MIVAGVDAGAQCLKIALAKEECLLSHCVVEYRGEVLSTAQHGLERALQSAGIGKDELEYVVATGIEKDAICFADEQVSEALCCAQGIYRFLPSAKTVVDLGAEKTLVIRCEDGMVLATARNDKCAAGTSTYLKMVSNLLGIDMQKMEELSLQAENDISVENTCAVFAETEIISLIHHKHALPDIIKGVLNGWTRRIYSLLVKVNFQKDVALVGGMAKNKGIMAALEGQIGFSLLIPDEPIIVNAAGAAAIAVLNRARRKS